MTKKFLIAAAFTVAVALGGPITDSPEIVASTLAGPSAVSAPADGPLVLTLSTETAAVPAVADPTTLATAPAASDGVTTEGTGVTVSAAPALGAAAPAPLAGAVPEPTTFGFLAVGLAATFLGSYRRKN